MGRTTILAMVMAVSALLLACDSEPDARCQHWVDCCTAMQNDIRFDAHDVVRQQCPPQVDMSEGDQCYQGRTQMISDIIDASPVLRDFIPSQCM